MANYDQDQMRVRVGAGDAAIDQGLRSYMLGVYNYMAGALAVTGVVAYLAFTMAVTQTSGSLELTAFGQAIFMSPLKWVVMLAPLGMVLLLGFRVHSMSLSAVQTTFWVYAGLMGLSLSTIFLVYTGNSIATTFFVTAASFGALSLYGYTTKRSLSAMGSFLMMGLFGIIIASLVQLFLQSPGLQFAISVLGVLIFAGLTAWDTQRIKEMYFAGDDASVAGKKAVMGALSLYLDFINLFLFMLRFMGNQRS
ncbi:MAG: Bax inhibitor-1/YccA family protein [Parvibaculum sp.]